jgi:hypothetical protein
MTDCHTECDCPGEPHTDDCSSHVECAEQSWCDKHFAEAIQENQWMRHVSLGAVTGVMSEQDKQDLCDAGRGHLLP